MFRLMILSVPVISLLMGLGPGDDSPAVRADLAFQPPIITATPEKPECTKCRRPTADGTEVLNEAPNVTDLAIDKKQVTVSCGGADGQSVSPPATGDAIATVKTTAEDPENDVMVYNYTVSGGRLVGTGANVIWNLDGVQPGRYIIVAGVDDGCGVCGKTVTKEVTVACSTS